MSDIKRPPRDDAPPALDRAAVEALEEAARAAESVWNPPYSGAETPPVIVALRFTELATATNVLQLCAAWKDAQILGEAMSANRDLGASNDELRLRVHRLETALRSAEAALSDIGDAEREEGDDLAWCEHRAAEALPTVRAALEGSKSHA